MTAIKETEQALAIANTAGDEARERLAAVEDRLAEINGSLAEVDDEITKSIEAGSDPTPLRERRSAILAQHENLSQEHNVLAALVERRQKAEKAAYGALDGARLIMYAENAAATGDEIRSHLTAVLEGVEKIRRLMVADTRSRGVVRSCGIPEPVPEPKDAAGLTWCWAKLEELALYADRFNSRARVAG